MKTPWEILPKKHQKCGLVQLSQQSIGKEKTPDFYNRVFQPVDKVPKGTRSTRFFFE
jgi:hypothetical protein